MSNFQLFLSLQGADTAHFDHWKTSGKLHFSCVSFSQVTAVR